MNDTTNKIVEWHHARNLIDGSTNEAQFKKLKEEVGELYSSIFDEVSPVDDIGDVYVVLCNIATREGLTMQECDKASMGAGFVFHSAAQGLSSVINICRQLRWSLADNARVDQPIGACVRALRGVANIHNLTLEDCIEHAYNDIKDRTGQMVDGIFVKDEL